MCNHGMLSAIMLAIPFQTLQAACVVMTVMERRFQIVNINASFDIRHLFHLDDS